MSTTRTEEPDEKAPLIGNRELAWGMLFSTVGSLSYQGCLWLITVLVVTLSSNYENSGILAIAMATGNMFFAIGTYNMRTYQVSDIQNRYRQSDYVGLRVVTIVLAWAILIPYTMLIAHDSSVIVATTLFLLFKTDECLADVLYGVDQRAGRIDTIGISQFVRGVMVVVMFTIVLRCTSSLNLAILAMLAGAVCVTLLYDIRKARIIDRIAPRFSRESLAGLLVICLPVAAAPLLTNMVVSVPRQYFSYLYGSEALGRYAAVATPAVLIQAASRYLYLPLLVPMAKLWDAGEPGRYLATVRRTLAIMVVAATGVVVTLSFAGRLVLPLVYGESIVEYVYLFPFVLCGTAAIAVLWFLTDSLVICRDTFGQLLAGGVAFASAAVLMVPLERLWYMNGINMTIIASISLGIAVALIRLGRVARKDRNARQRHP